MELLSPDFLEQVRKHSQGDPKAKVSEMEHALRKHCTIHFDEDPAFYQRLSDKLEKLIEAHRDNWQVLAEGYEELRREAEAGGQKRWRVWINHFNWTTPLPAKA